MKYQPTFDQVICKDFGFNAADGMLIDLIISAATWCKSIVVDDREYYYLAQSKIVDELPCVFGSTQAVRRSTKRINGVLDIHQVGLSYYYRVSPEFAQHWGRKEKGESYQEYLHIYMNSPATAENGAKQLPPKTAVNTADNGGNRPKLPPKTAVNTADNGGNRPKLPPKTAPIKQPINKTTNIQQQRAREVGVEIPASLSDDVVVVCNLIKKIDPGIRQTVVNELGDKVVQGKVHGSVGAYLAGVIKKIKQNGYSKPKGPRPKWADIPDDDNKLMRWAKAHGYDKPKRGELSGPYRRRLSDQVAARWRDQAGEGAAYA